MSASPSDRRSWLDRPIFDSLPALTGEAFIFAGVILLVIFSRLYNLGERVMSHDESLHVYFSWLFYRGQGYQHNPMMHGPLQFHLIALSYLLFGDNDFTARLPHAIASILTVVMLWNWRRYLGRIGTLIAAALMLISPFMLYYGRYARNEAFVGLFGVLTLYSILRYFETGKSRYLFLLSAATALNFTSKETAFIYTAQALLFLGVYLLIRVSKNRWKYGGLYNGFVIAILVAALFLSAAYVLNFYTQTSGISAGSQTIPPLAPGQPSVPLASNGQHVPSISLLIGLSIISLIAAVFLMITGYGWKNLLKQRAFTMIILLGTLVLPQMSALFARLLGLNPINYAYTWPVKSIQALIDQEPVRTGLVLIACIILSIAVGLLWNRKLWLINAAIFYGIYVFFYTSIFTNWQGIFTGMVGSLGYWLVQQGVQRGSQPWYYYLLIQIPIYEFLPAMGMILAAYFGLRRNSPPSPIEDADPEDQSATADGDLTFPLLFWWSLSSLFAYSIAGEKMPWLTFHIALPMILVGAWALGRLIETMDWRELLNRRGPLLICCTAILLIGALVVAGILIGPNSPFSGKTILNLSSSDYFLFWLFSALASGVALYYLSKGIRIRSVASLVILTGFGLLFVLTGRTSFRAAFTNFDNAEEYLVYAHGSSGIKDVLHQLDLVSKQVAGAASDLPGGHNLVFAYDTNQTSQGVAWPFTWYFRDYPNAHSFTQPTADLLNDPVVLVDESNFASAQTILSDQYYQFDYIRMVWPNQDYFNLTFGRVWNAISNPSMRSAILQIWLNRDFRQYANLTNSNSFTPATWEPSAKMRLYVRKDVADQIWEYGTGQSNANTLNPYADATISVKAETVFGQQGAGDTQLNDPHGIALARDGSIFIADTNNNRIEHFDSAGNVINTIGSYGESDKSEAPLGTLNQPWDLALSPDGQFLYVVDTWNHRIEKFSTDGTAISAWGGPMYQPPANDPFGLWGPRGIAVDGQGRVYVADTGNKRIIVYDGSGNYITQFGGAGLDPGKFDEPVGLAIDDQGNLYVADTWNRRIQVFAPNANSNSFSPVRQWDISGWFSNSLEDKPYIALDQAGHIFITDPEMYRVLEFTTQGQFIRAWGDYGTDDASFGRTAGVAVDAQGTVWVSDAANNRVMKFVLP